MRTVDTLPDNRIRELRDARNWSVRELAEKTDIDFSTLNRFERGTQPIDLPRMRRIARALGVKPSEILADEDVELRADEIGHNVLDALSGIAREDMPDLVKAAREVARVARQLAARRSAAALAGNDAQVAALADLWNRWTDAERDRALEILRIANPGVS